jgi:rhodanese-related sulfurtransferase
VSLLGRIFGGGVPAVSALEARRLVDDGAAMVDVRTTREWNAGHAPFALHVQLTDLAARMHRLPKGRPVVVVCRSGSRSRSACRSLAAAGYDVVNLRGGMASWSRSGQPVVSRAGRPGSVV